MPFIEAPESEYEPRIKELFDQILTESIESALHTRSQNPSDIVTNEPKWVGLARNDVTATRKSSLLTGICKLLLLISLYEEPQRGVV